MIPTGTMVYSLFLRASCLHVLPWRQSQRRKGADLLRGMSACFVQPKTSWDSRTHVPITPAKSSEPILPVCRKRTCRMCGRTRGNLGEPEMQK
jgi:hypothetical protein